MRVAVLLVVALLAHTCAGGVFTFKDTIVGEQLSLRVGLWAADDAPAAALHANNKSYALANCERNSNCHVVVVVGVFFFFFFFFSLL
jgi:hypothetical protein